MKKTIFLLLLLTQISYAQVTTKSTPNIILIMTDQHNARALSCMGNKDLQTPNIDNLANSGILFNNAYVTFPLCTPSRSSIFTGKMPHSIGVNSNKDGDNRIIDEEKQKILGNTLSQAGYDCAYGGKWHAHEASISAGNGFEFIAPMGDIGLAEKSIEYIKSRKNVDPPFFLVVSFDNPHNICEWARNEPLPYGNIPLTTIDNTPKLPVNFLKSKTFPEVLQLEQAANKKVYPTANYTNNDWRNYLYAYYRLVEKVDREIGKIINAIDNTGIREKTLIIFTSDHGDGNAAHGWNQKTSLFQESIRVPFIINYKGHLNTQSPINKTLISNGLDLYPTICSYAGVDNKYSEGQNLRPLLENKSDEVGLSRDFIVVETKFEGKQAYGTTGRAIVGKKYKYIIYNWGKNREQLFDIEKDPFEMDNLVESKKHAKIVNKYREILRKWCLDNEDYDFLKKVILPENSPHSSSSLFLKPY